MQVHEIVSREEAVRRSGRNTLYHVDEWLAGKPGTGSLLNLHRMLDPDLARELLFISGDSEKGLFFKANTSNLDSQTLRGVRELTPQSAVLLDEIINITDHLPPGNNPIKVSRDSLKQWSRR
jgi:hypothetical protein